MRIRATVVAALSFLLVMGLAPAASAAPAPATVTTSAPADLWTSKVAMRMAWAQLSYGDRVDVCDAFYTAPSYVVGRLVRSQSGLTSWERRTLRSWMRGYLYNKCSAYA